MPPGGASPGPDGKMGPVGLGGAASEDITPNGINRLRYVLSKEIEPVRRIPVAFTIVVDQAYRNEVLAAVANSRLRIQTTWVYWTHRDYRPLTGAGIVQGYVPPDRGMMSPGGISPVRPGAGGSGGFKPPASPPPPGSGAPPGVGSAAPPGGITSPGPGTTSPGPVMPLQGNQPTQPADSAAMANRNLIELTVHGVAALFERYPPKPKSPEGTNPTAPK